MPNTPGHPTWLAEAVIYQIYPQSFADSNGDGIGDLPGVTSHLDYLRDLGVNTLWFSPLFVSPFRDAGYDVADYTAVDPRYGTEADLGDLVAAARTRGMRVMLDLVAGHTSDQHPWFGAAADDPSDDRFIWSDSAVPPGPDWAPSPGARPGHYLPNFYSFQPALNFGYARPHPDEPWRQSVDAAGPRLNRAALREIMAYWFDRGIAGFRVDMAASLVKDDPGLTATSALWRDLRDWLDDAYPDRVLLSEWGDPKRSVPAGLHADFFLHFVGRPLLSLWGNAQGSHSADWPSGPCYFAPEGDGSMREFLDAWHEADTAIDGRGFVALPTANHDFSRLTCGTRTRSMVAPAFAFQLTWPSLPVIYYGDEIGMRYLPGLPDVEGSQLGSEARQGSRTPMQWDDSPNAGFTEAPSDRQYLPLDPDPGRPTVAGQLADPDSLLHQVRALIALRASRPELGTGGSVEVLNDGYPFVCVRGDTYLIVVNPSGRTARYPLDGFRTTKELLVRGIESGSGGELLAAPFSYGIFELAVR
ncbi:alpha-amylase family glycosyl hydrolase [Streptomyces sp. NBC_00859]|uniref:alpha-amylase family glycosyl hydrolase n=1 Tax=Streptomyces sp. NBC_00859 TaxID=2903682 RepID=UPI00387065E4|nr:alpha-amylase family glycosyl hydrolase [Streptomyces sp. NBC_00859]